MQLVINTYGSYLQKSGDCFKIRNDDRVFDVSVALLILWLVLIVPRDLLALGLLCHSSGVQSKRDCRKLTM